MRRDEVHILPKSADAFDSLEIVGDVGRVNVDLSKIAWLVLILTYLPDEADIFPHGKWATIQHLQSQLDFSASARSAEVLADKATRNA